MKILVQASRPSVPKSRQHLKLEQVRYLLERHEKIERSRFLKILADVLVFPESFMTTFPAEILAGIMVECFEYLESRTEAIDMRLVPLPNGLQQILMISAPNAPYLVETLTTLERHHGHAMSLIAHPVLTIKRRERRIVSLTHQAEEDGGELFVLIRLENADDDKLESIQHQCRVLLHQTLAFVANASAFDDTFQSLASLSQLEEYRPLLTWLRQEAFIPMSYHVFPVTPAQSDTAKTIRKPNLGADLQQCLRLFQKDAPNKLHAQICQLTCRENIAVVHQLNIVSPLIAEQPLTYLGFREQREGTVTEHAFIGLFKTIEMHCASCHVTELQQKIATILGKIKINRGSHDYIKLREIFSLFPKLEMFFLSETQLYLLAQSLCRYLSRPQALKLLFLAPPSPLLLSFLVIIPRGIFSAISKTKLADTLSAALQSRLQSSRLIDYGESYSALHLTLYPDREHVNIDINELEKLLDRQCRPWSVRLRALMERALGKVDGSRLWRIYHDAFGEDYRSMMPPRYALRDILHLKQMNGQAGSGAELMTPCQGVSRFRLHFYAHREQFLDEYIPILENLDLRLIDQVQFCVTTAEETVYIKSFAVIPAAGNGRPLHRVKVLLLELIKAIQLQRVENDGLNRLLLLTGMAWQEIDVLRTYRNYCLQLGFHATVSSFHRALIAHPQIARLLFDYFEVRFRPDGAWNDPLLREEQGLFPIRMRLLQEMEVVADLNDDRILRMLFNLIDSTVRSNFHIRRELDDYLIAIKINSLGVIDMPAPRPAFEIYVHAADMEGIHLRGGKIARGGIRWSDRPDDFRTEILGLMQTQMSKNALIVPTGAKGGFVVKRQHTDETPGDAGKRAYQQLMHGLLDLTDNYDDERVVTLPGIVRYDDDDPYLVVAADKGTAQFPDVANAIAAKYQFWMNDAFASGGSKGYNHKLLGITARGAWESVKRHFRERGKDIQREAFTVVGIGSMDGDVFGNGMLLSRCILLKAAISGRHIFLDPEPDPETSWQERRRLFDLPGSSWDDYERNLLSDGGGVYSRDNKDIPLSEPVRHWLGIRHKTLDGETLIRHLLTAPAELLWLGGIGTYVKASVEKHEDVGDRQNDNVRVDAADLRASVVGEGANLGFTRRARIEYALAGGAINTDAVDNSAGVDTSDHEVNLKILLRILNRKRLIDDYQTLFDRLSDDVCRSVLANNYDQTLSLSLERIRCNDRFESYLELADKLQVAGFLDFSVEAFPPAKIVRIRDKDKLTRPELAVLMAAAKRWLTQQLLEHQEFVPGDCCDHYLSGYFPPLLVERFAAQLPAHPLASAIKATCISNLIINQAGCLFLTRNNDPDNGGLCALVGSYLAFDRIFEGEGYRKAVYSLDNRVETEVQYRALLELEDSLVDFAEWSVENAAALKPEEKLIADYRDYLNRFVHYVGQQQRPPLSGNAEPAVQLPERLEMSRRLLANAKDFPACVKAAIETGSDIERVAALFDETARFLHLDALINQTEGIQVQDVWERKLLNELERGIKQFHGSLVESILRSSDSGVADFFSGKDRTVLLNRYYRFYRDNASALGHQLTPYLVWYRELEKLLQPT